LTAGKFRERNTRKASVLQVGGFRPTLAALASNFVPRAGGAARETWPHLEAKPMLFVCQMNLADAPAVPTMLAERKHWSVKLVVQQRPKPVLR
jgi:hypothetical protein